ncbi:MAG: hypothetical protein AABZ22_03845, partial [Nitrospirota bacterium]
MKHNPGFLKLVEWAKQHIKQCTIGDVKAKLADFERDARPRFEDWLKSGATDIPAPPPTAAFAFDEVANNSTPNSA